MVEVVCICPCWGPLLFFFSLIMTIKWEGFSSVKAVNRKALMLNWWNLDVGCLRVKDCLKEGWIRVLLLYLCKEYSSSRVFLILIDLIRRCGKG